MHSRFSLTEVRGLPVQRAVEHVEDLFEKAKDMQPCLLLLKNVNSLTPPSSQSRDKPDEPDLVASAFWEARASKGVVIIATAEQAGPPPPPPLAQLAVSKG